MPLKPPKRGRADGPLVAGGAVGELEQDQGEGERDDAEIDVADPAVEHEVAEEGSRKGRDGQGQGHRTGGVAEVDGGDGVGVAAEAEEGGLAEAQDAAEAPDQSLREGEDGEADEDGGVDEGEELERGGQEPDGGHAGGEGQGHLEPGAAGGGHLPALTGVDQHRPAHPL